MRGIGRSGSVSSSLSGRSLCGAASCCLAVAAALLLALPPALSFSFIGSSSTRSNWIQPSCPACTAGREAHGPAVRVTSVGRRSVNVVGRRGITTSLMMFNIPGLVPPSDEDEDNEETTPEQAAREANLVDAELESAEAAAQAATIRAAAARAKAATKDAKDNFPIGFPAQYHMNNNDDKSDNISGDDEATTKDKPKGGDVGIDIFASVLNNDMKAVAEYCARGGDLSVTDDIGDTPLLLATENHLSDMIVYLVTEQGVDVNSKSTQGGEETSLHLAAYYAYTELVKMLVEGCGADLDVQNKKGDTPLQTAAFWGNSETVEYLLESGANPDIRNNDGFKAGEQFEAQFAGDDQEYINALVQEASKFHAEMREEKAREEEEEEKKKKKKDT